MCCSLFCLKQFTRIPNPQCLFRSCFPINRSLPQTLIYIRLLLIHLHILFATKSPREELEMCVLLFSEKQQGPKFEWEKPVRQTADSCSDLCRCCSGKCSSCKIPPKERRRDGRAAAAAPAAFFVRGGHWRALNFPCSDCGLS